MFPQTTYQLALISASLLLWACGQAVSDAGSGAASNATNTDGVAHSGAAGSTASTEGSAQTTDGSSSTRSTSAGPTLDIDGDLLSGCDRVAAASCGTLERCSPVLYASDYPDRDSCNQAFAAQCVGSLEVVPNIEASELDSCASAIDNLSCADWLLNVDPSECQRYAERSREEECAQDWECASGTCYVGKCQEPGGEGEPCAMGHRPCQVGLLCGAVVEADGSTRAFCTPPLEPGDPCDLPSSACPFPTACVDGSCVEPEPGIQCDTPSDCGARWAVGSCDTGNCSGACPGVCAEYKLVSVGETCGQHLVCDATSYCSMGHVSWKGTCYARPSIGESCEQQFNVTPPECVVGAQCVDNFCVADP